MIQHICAVYDRAAQLYWRPFTVRRPSEAVRGFSDEVLRQAADNQMFHHPEDFDLYCLGTIDDSTGRLSGYDLPVQLARAQDVRFPSAVDASSLKGLDNA